MQGQQDPLRGLADDLRSKGGVAWRQAVLHDKRVEFFRGKDFAAYFREDPDKMAAFVTKGELPDSCNCNSRSMCSCVVLPCVKSSYDTPATPSLPIALSSQVAAASEFRDSPTISSLRKWPSAASQC